MLVATAIFISTIDSLQ